MDLRTAFALPVLLSPGESVHVWVLYVLAILATAYLLDDTRSRARQLRWQTARQQARRLNAASTGRRAA